MGWLGDRRTAKAAATFWDLLQGGREVAAVAHFDAQLADPGETSPELRVAYYLLRWMDVPDATHLQRIQAAAREPDAGPAAARAVRLLAHSTRLRGLTLALERRQATAPGGVERDPSLAASAPYEQLAAALVATYGIGLAAKAAERRETAARVQRLLPPEADLEGRAVVVRQRLDLWAAVILCDYERVLTLVQQPGLVTADQARRLSIRALGAKGAEALAAGDASKALRTLRRVAPLLTPSQLRNVVSAWVAEAMDGDLAAVAAFLAEAVQGLGRVLAPRGGGASGVAELTFAWGVALLGSGQQAAGLQRVAAAFKMASDAEAPPAHAAAIQAQALMLEACEQLSEVGGWPTPDPSTEAGRATLVANRTLWAAARARLEGLARSLSQVRHPDSSFAHVLVGVLAHIESDRMLSAAQLQRISTGVSRLTGAAGVARLRAMEAALHHRTEATAEAIALLGRGALPELADLYRSVLLPLGAAVSPLVRLAVVMALWDGGRLTDPLPLLDALADAPGVQAAVTRAARAVRVREALVSLASACRAGTAVPSLAALDGEPALARLGAVAAAAIRLRAGHTREAAAAVATIDDAEIGPTCRRIRFHAAFVVGDLAELQRLAEDLSFLRDPERARRATLGRLLVAATEATDEAALEAWVRERLRAGRLDARGLVGVTVGLATGRDPARAARLLGAVLRTAGADLAGAAHLRGVVPVLEALVAARTGRAAQAVATFEAIADGAAPPDPASWGGPDAARRLQGWSRLFALAGQLALAVGSGGDVRARWPSMRRALQARAEALSGSAELSAYGDLVVGLLAHLCSDELVDEATLARLDRARRVLPLARHAAFLEQTVSKLTWRKRLMADFWARMARGQLGEGRAIYRTELLPAFGDRMPPQVTLAAILADWDAGDVPLPELERRLDALDAAGPRRELVRKLREQMEDAQRVTELTARVRGRDFGAIVEFVQTARWAGCAPGAMPVPAAIALLYALAQKEENEEALRLGGNIEQAKGLPQWVQDHAALVLGYLRFKARAFDQAAESFERISSSTHLGHDTDRYWAASHFSRGLELLEGDQRSKSFDAFARSVGRRGQAGTARGLAPLFAHFGLKNIEANSGARALQAFELLSESLEGAERSPPVARDRLVAEVGRVLCRCLVDDPPVPSGDVLALLTPLQAERAALPEGAAPALERSIRLLGLCQELKLARRQKAVTAKDVASLRQRLAAQADAVDALAEGSGRVEPTMLVLRGVTALVFAPGVDEDRAVEQVSQAMSLGIHSSRLTQLLQALQQRRAKSVQDTRRVLDLIDVFLGSDDVPERARRELVRDPEVQALYRLNRGYRPREVGTQGRGAGVRALCDRLTALLEYARQESAGSAAVAELQAGMAALEQEERHVLEVERRLMAEIAGKVRKASVQMTSKEVR